MRFANSRAAVVVAAVLFLVGGLNLAAYAANGKPLLLGTSNASNRITGVTNTGWGPALALKTRPGSPPLTVNTKRKVARLNADAVDGIDSRAMVNRAYHYTVAASPTYTQFIEIAFPQLRAGIYMASYSLTFESRATTTTCYFLTPPGEFYGYTRFMTTGNEYLGHNATAMLTVGPTGIKLRCFGYSPDSLRLFNQTGDAQSTVAFVPVAMATQRTTTGNPQPFKPARMDGEATSPR